MTTKKKKISEQQQTELQQLKTELENRPQMPTGEQVQEYAVKDLQAAISFLRLLLEHPEELKKIVHAIYQELVQQERETIIRLEKEIKELEALENA